MKITKEQLKDIIQEELETAMEAYRPSSYRRRRGEIPSKRMSPDVMKRGGEGTDVHGTPIGPGPAMSAEAPVENLEADAEKIVDNMRSFARMGLMSTTNIPNPELKALVLDMAPDLADRIS